MTEKKEELSLVSKATAMQKFDDFKKDLLEVCGTIKKMEITDQPSCDLLVEEATKANKLLKKIDGKRSTVKAPYLEACKTIDSGAKEFIKPLEEVVKISKSKIKEWTEKQEKLKAEKIAELRGKMEANKDEFQSEIKLLQFSKDFMEEAAEYIQNVTDSAINRDKYAEQMKEFLSKFPHPDLFGKTVQLAKELRTKTIALVKVKLEFMGAGDNANAKLKKIMATTYSDFFSWLNFTIGIIQDEIEAAEALMTASNASVVSTMIETSKESSGVSTAGLWKFEITNFKDVDDFYKTINEAAVRAWMKENKEEMEKNPESALKGIKFFKDKSVRL